MEYNEFIEMCKEHSIDPCIALENEDITEILGISMDIRIMAKAKIDLILKEEF